MRFVFVAVALVWGCKGGGKAESAAPKVVEGSNAGNEEQELLSRRDELFSSRTKLRKERAQVASEIEAKRAAGADTSELDKRMSGLIDKENKLMAEEESLFRRQTALLQQYRTTMNNLAGSGDKSQRIAGREAAVAGREKDFSRRESRLAERERLLAQRERTLAQREKETCGAGAGAPMIVQTIDVKGSKYTKADVDPLLRKARGDMSRKGVMRSDLPGPAQGLEKEATRAMQKGDYGKARFAASQLLGYVRAVRVNRAFVQAKWARLSRKAKGKTMSKEGEKLLREATASIVDGRFSAANRKLNRIYALLR